MYTLGGSAFEFPFLIVHGCQSIEKFEIILVTFSMDISLPTPPTSISYGYLALNLNVEVVVEYLRLNPPPAGLYNFLFTFY